MAKKYTITDVYKAAGKSFTDLALASLGGNKDLVVEWFYNSNMPGFDDKTPYEIYKEGRISELENRLIQLATGNIGA